MTKSEILWAVIAVFGMALFGAICTMRFLDPLYALLMMGIVALVTTAALAVAANVR